MMTKTRLLSIALFVSVAVNVFAIAVFLTPVFHHRGDGMHVPRFGAAMMADLSPDTRTAVHDLWHEARGDMRAQIRQMRQARRQLTMVLTADDYDDEAVKAAQQAVAIQMDQMRSLTDEKVRAMAQLLTDEERQTLFKRGLKGHWGGFRPPHHGGPPAGGF